VTRGGRMLVLRRIAAGLLVTAAVAATASSAASAQ
jgi:hypothetical protein